VRRAVASESNPDLDEPTFSALNDEYEQVIRMLVSMAVNAKKWTL